VTRPPPPSHLPPPRPPLSLFRGTLCNAFSPSYSLCYSADDLDAARSYYSMSLQLKPDGNLRAAWGLALATSHLAAAPASKEQDANVEALNAIAVRTLGQQYGALKNTQLVQVVREWAGR
jgi:hypothetical protein